MSATPNQSVDALNAIAALCGVFLSLVTVLGFVLPFTGAAHSNMIWGALFLLPSGPLSALWFYVCGCCLRGSQRLSPRVRSVAEAFVWAAAAAGMLAVVLVVYSVWPLYFSTHR